MRLDSYKDHTQVAGHMFSDGPVIVLSRRNLQSLLDKLDDPESARTLVAPKRDFAVFVEDDDVHYADRAAPGPVYMPGSGEVR